MLGFCKKLRRLILIYELFLTNTTFRFRTKLRHLTYWLKWRVHSAIIGDSITPATPPQEGNGLALYLCGHEATTPSGCACHPSTGGELTSVDTRQPPRQATPATPPQEGNGLALCLSRHGTTTPSGCACHPSTGGEWSGTMLIQIRGNHPVRLRLPPLHRRGMVRHHAYTDTKQPPRQATPATPPQEGNGLALYLYRYEATTPSGYACHPSTGGELPGADTKQFYPVGLRLATPPQEGNGLALYLCGHEATTPSGCACHPSTGREWSGTILMQIRSNHLVRLRPPPLHRRGMVRHHAYTDTAQPPRQATPATPPQEGN